MIKTILWDLDGTLLPMDLNHFLKNYFRSLTSHVAHIMDPQEVLQHVMTATDIMMKDESTKTNEEVFYDAFGQRVNHLTQKLYDAFEDFYKNEFRKLVVYTKPTGLSRPMVADLQNKGYRLVLATNPIFPLDAIMARMEWAEVDDLDWARITSYENSSYCKPNLKYYQQILSEVQSTPEECMMVGNSPADDIVAGRLGIKTYLVEGEDTEADEFVYSGQQNKAATTYKPDLRGSLAELVTYMKALPPLA